VARVEVGGTPSSNPHAWAVRSRSTGRDGSRGRTGSWSTRTESPARPTAASSGSIRARPSSSSSATGRTRPS